ncbi:MAG: diguanylate cyclase [Actinomycetota bacterium]|nr:diguanylate cyclase [Actinomycetota bacterium]
MIADTSNPVLIAPNTYWVGVNDHPLGLQCNPYLILDGDDAVLIDPGSVLDFEYVRAQVEKLIPISSISTIALSHQDPDLCSSVTLFERAGFEGHIATHWRASVLQRYYGITSPFYLVNEHQYALTLRSGKVIEFIPTPYLHFPGAVATFDPQTRVLFSGDLFGAFSTHWSFRADKSTYIEGMKAFHEHYMPSNDNIRPVMEMLLAMDIDVIAPQHGSIIDADIADYIVALRELECGTMLNPIRHELAASGGFTSIVEQVIRRLQGLYQADEVLGVVQHMEMTIDPGTLTIGEFSYTGVELWNALFQTMADAGKQSWLTAVEPLVRKLAAEYDIEMPQYYLNERSTTQVRIDQLAQEIDSLRALNVRLDTTLRESEDKLTRCPLTGLRNERFFTEFLPASVAQAEAAGQDLTLVYVGADRIADVTYARGKQAGDEVIKSVGYLLERGLERNEQLFRLDGPNFVQMLIEVSGERAVLTRVERIRREVAMSTISLDPLTVSIGTVSLSEARTHQPDPAEHASLMARTGLLRLRVASNRGGDTICSTSDIEHPSTSAGTIVIADPDPVNIDVLTTALQAMNFETIGCSDGLQALQAIEHGSISVVIAEAVLPKLDGFALREALSSASAFRELPFLMMGYEKDAETVARAQSLGINHFFKKPYLLSELVGTVRLEQRPRLR